MKLAAGGPTIAVVAGSVLRTRIGSALREVGIGCQEWDSWNNSWVAEGGSGPDLILSGLSACSPDAWHLSAYQKEQARRGRRIRVIVLGSQPPSMSTALEDDEPIGDTSDIRRIVARVQELIEEWRACPGTLTIDRQLIDSMLDGYALHEMIFDADATPWDYRFLLVNPAFERLTGLPVESVVGRRLSEVLPGTGSEWIDTYGKVVITGEPCRFEAYHEGLDRHFEVVGFRPREGQFACLFRDITDQKRQQASVQSSEQRHRAVIQTALDGFAMFDLEGRLLDVNDEMCRLSLYPREDLLRLRVFDLDARLSPQELRDHIRHVQYAGTNHLETLLRRKDGQHVEIELSLCYWSVDGVFFAFLRDIAGRKQREREREAMLELLSLVNMRSETAELLGKLTRFFREWGDFDAVGIRLRAESGFPYFASTGLSSGFIERENSLCSPDTPCQNGSDCQGKPPLEGLCGMLLSGAPVTPGLLTPHGSFWTNSLSDWVRNFHAAAQPRRFRGCCLKEGYQSIALIPLRVSGNTIGLLQLNDRRPDRLSPEMISFLEEAAGSLAIALEERSAQAALAVSEEKFRAIADYTVDWENWFGTDGRLRWVNPAVERLTGYSPEECFTLPDFPLCVIHPADRERCRREFLSAVDGASCDSSEFRVLRKDGAIRWCMVAWRPISDSRGLPIGHRSSVRDIDKRKRAELVMEARLRLLAFAAHHELGELLRETLDEAERLTGSSIGFYHFVESDEQTLSLQAWSTRTQQEFCRAEGRNLHYSIGEAGVWTDCIRVRAPLIHNDYASLPHRRGMPEGHAEVIRELVVPVLRRNRIVAILGIGNKSLPYDDSDIEVVALLADLAWDIVERERAAAALEASERSYRELIERLPEGTIVHQNGLILFLNKEAARILGIARPELAVGSPLARYLPSEADVARGERLRLLLEGTAEASRGEEKWTREDGRGIEVETSITRAVFQGREALHEVFRDITDRKRLEQEFLQAQKMESLGRLAGGIAHDFNNLLTVINGYSRLLLDPATAARSLPAAADQIHEAGERAAALVRQLLVFSRKQVSEKKLIDPNEIIAGTGKMLGRLLGEHIDVVTRLGSPMDCVLMDPYQLEQVIVNLAVNARDAMPEGGTFRIETESLTSDGCARVHLHFHDTGVGMDEPVLQRLFEPFFTTKEVGRGTGLGLSMVQSVILQAKGTIEVTSKPGAGTSFHVYLPASCKPNARSAPAASTEPRRGNGTILLVEDQREVRDFLVTVLSDLGYRVLIPETGGDPVSLCRAQPVDLLLSDVVMPGESGPELARRLRAEFPGIRVLFISGYLGEDHTAVSGALRDAALLAKPFTPHALTEKIREVLSPRPGIRA